MSHLSQWWTAWPLGTTSSSLGARCSPAARPRWRLPAPPLTSGAPHNCTPRTPPHCTGCPHRTPHSRCPSALCSSGGQSQRRRRWGPWLGGGCGEGAGGGNGDGARGQPEGIPICPWDCGPLQDWWMRRRTPRHLGCCGGTASSCWGDARTSFVLGCRTKKWRCCLDAQQRLLWGDTRGYLDFCSSQQQTLGKKRTPPMPC